MELFWRTWLAAVSVIVAVGLLLTTLVTLEFRRDYERLLGERMLVIGASAAAPFSAAAELGLSISSVRNASALLDISRQTDPLISGAWVLNAERKVVHGTGRWIIDQDEVTPISLAGDAHADEWFSPIGSHFVSGTPIRDSQAEQVGQVLIAYPLDVIRTRVLAMAAELSFLVLMIAVAASLAAGLLLRVWFAREIGAFNSVGADLAEFERRAWTMQPDQERGGQTGDVRGMLAQSRAAYSEHVGKLSEGDNPDNALRER